MYITSNAIDRSLNCVILYVLTYNMLCMGITSMATCVELIWYSIYYFDILNSQLQQQNVITLFTEDFTVGGVGNIQTTFTLRVRSIY